MILNYTTTVPAEKTVAQIIALLARKNASSITQDFYPDGRVKAIRFIMRVGQLPVVFALPSNVDGVAGILAKEKPYKARSQGSRDQYTMRQREDAERISWRILKDWVEAQIALIESGQADPAQVFMPYAQRENGQTMYQLWLESTQKALPNGGAE